MSGTESGGWKCHGFRVYKKQILWVSSSRGKSCFISPLVICDIFCQLEMSYKYSIRMFFGSIFCYACSKDWYRTILLFYKTSFKNIYIYMHVNFAITTGHVCVFTFIECIETVKLTAWERDTQVKHVQLECVCMCMYMLGWRHREG